MKNLKYLLIALVLGVSAFTHLYRIDKTFIFNNDEGRDALIAYRMIETKLPVLLGPETSVGNMYLGPFYYYLMVFPLAVAGLNPVGPAIMVGIFGIVTTLLIIILGKRLFGLITGLVGGLLYAIIPIMVFGSRSSWNPNVIPLFITLILLFYPAKNRLYSIIIGALTGIIFQLHYVALILPALLIVRDLYFAWRKKKWREFIIHVALVAVGFIVTSFPFWLFEIRHGFVNMQAFFNYLISKSGDSGTVYPPYLSRVFTNIKFLISEMIGSISLAFSPVSWLTWAVGALTLTLFVVSAQGILSYLLLGSIILVSVLKESIHIHYVSFLYPVVSLALAYALTKKWILMIPAFILIVSLAMPGYVSLKYHLWEVNSTQTIRASDTANYIVEEAGGRPYNVVNASTSSTSTILYYLAISKNPPKNDDQSLLFVICEKALCGDDILTRTDLFINGPSHPTLINYLGYTPRLNSGGTRTLLKNEWVTYDIHVATIEVKP